MTEQQTFFEALTDVNTVQQEALGTLRWVGNKCYKYVAIKNVGGTVAGAAGDFAVYTADSYDVHQVSLRKADGDTTPIGAGVLQAAVTGTSGTAYYGWIQVKGAVTLNTAFTSAPANGQPLTPGTTDLAVTKANEADSAAVYKHVIGVCQDVTNKQIVLDCPF